MTAIVVLLLVGGAASYFLWQFDILCRVLAIAVAVFTTLLVTIGDWATMMKTEDNYPFEPPAAEKDTSMK